MKKYTYYRAHIKESNITYTGETKDVYFAKGEKAPQVMTDSDTHQEKKDNSTTISVGYSKTYASKYKEAFGNN